MAICEKFSVKEGIEAYGRCTGHGGMPVGRGVAPDILDCRWLAWDKDRKSTRLNSSHLGISYAVFCLKKKISDRSMPGSVYSLVECSQTQDQQIAMDMPKNANRNKKPIKHGRFFLLFLIFFFNDTATTEIYTLSLHDALPI